MCGDRFIVVIISQYIKILNHYVVHLRLTSQLKKKKNADRYKK